MDTLGMVSEPGLFVQRLHEHSVRVHQSVQLILPLVDALLANHQEKMKTLHEQMSQITGETAQIKLWLYGQINDMHFRSAGGYAFSQYLACQDKVADSAQDFADLLVSHRTTIPIELHSGFRAFVAQVVNVCEQTMILAEDLSSPTETVSPDTEAQDTLEAIRGILDGNRQAKRLGTKLAQRAYDLEEQLGPVTILFLDKYCATLYEMADGAERTANHLHLMIR